MLLLGGLASQRATASSPIDELNFWLEKPISERPNLQDQPFATRTLTRKEAAEARRMLWDDHVREIRLTRQKKWDEKAITIGDQTIDIERHDGVKTVTVLLNDAMADLDQAVTITVAGKEQFQGIVPRSIGQTQRTLTERGDPDLIFSASKTVQIE